MKVATTRRGSGAGRKVSDSGQSLFDPRTGVYLGTATSLRERIRLAKAARAN